MWSWSGLLLFACPCFWWMYFFNFNFNLKPHELCLLWWQVVQVHLVLRKNFAPQPQPPKANPQNFWLWIMKGVGYYNVHSSLSQLSKVSARVQMLLVHVEKIMHWVIFDENHLGLPTLKRRSLKVATSMFSSISAWCDFKWFIVVFTWISHNQHLVGSSQELIQVKSWFFTTEPDQLPMQWIPI